MIKMSLVNCEESYSTLVQKFYFELRVQVTLHVQLDLQPWRWAVL